MALVRIGKLRKIGSPFCKSLLGQMPVEVGIPVVYEALVAERLQKNLLVEVAIHVIESILPVIILLGRNDRIEATDKLTFFVAEAHAASPCLIVCGLAFYSLGKDNVSKLAIIVNSLLQPSLSFSHVVRAPVVP
jgi:hypothetical protein